MDGPERLPSVLPLKLGGNVADKVACFRKIELLGKKTH